MKLNYEKLKGKYINALPITEEHFFALKQAAAFDEIWTHYHKFNHYSENNFEIWFKSAIKNHAYTTQTIEGEIVGSSRYYNIDFEQAKLHIGSTFYTPTVWGTKVNVETIYLLLKNAFDSGIKKVLFHIDNSNQHSIAAVKKLGAELTQVIPKDRQRPDGTFKDTHELVVEQKTWPQTEAMLLDRINS